MSNPFMGYGLSYQSPPPQKKRYRWRLLIGMGIVLIAIVGGGVGWKLAHQQQVTPSQADFVPMATSAFFANATIERPISTLVRLSPTSTVMPLIGSQQEQATEILRLLNIARQAEGMVALQLNDQLTLAAITHSQAMAQFNFFAHEGLDGKKPADRVLATGYQYLWVGENILYRFDLSATGAYEQWWDSPPHHENMMTPDYRDIGIAYSLSDDGKYYYVMVLGARMP